MHFLKFGICIWLIIFLEIMDVVTEPCIHHITGLHMESRCNSNVVQHVIIPVFPSTEHFIRYHILFLMMIPNCSLIHDFNLNHSIMNLLRQEHSSLKKSLFVITHTLQILHLNIKLITVCVHNLLQFRVILLHVANVSFNAFYVLDIVILCLLNNSFREFKQFLLCCFLLYFKSDVWFSVGEVDCVT